MAEDVERLLWTMGFIFCRREGTQVMVPTLHIQMDYNQTTPMGKGWEALLATMTTHQKTGGGPHAWTHITNSLLAEGDPNKREQF